MTQEEVREGSKSIPNQGVKMRTMIFKISNNVETIASVEV